MNKSNDDFLKRKKKDRNIIKKRQESRNKTMNIHYQINKQYGRKILIFSSVSCLLLLFLDSWLLSLSQRLKQNAPGIIPTLNVSTGSVCELKR